MNQGLQNRDGETSTSTIIAKILLKSGIVDDAGLARAAAIRDRDQVSLQRAIVQLGLANEEEIASTIAVHFRYEYLGVQMPEIDSATLALISGEFCRKWMVVPLELKGRFLRLAVADPLAYHAIQDVEFLTGRQVTPVVASHTLIQRLLDKFYSLGQIFTEDYRALLDSVPTGQLEEAFPEDEDVNTTKLHQDTKLAPIVKLVNLILSNAVKEGASDIHFERHENHVQVRYRVDGLLHDVLQIPKALQDAAISRLKISSGLDISERRKPQDGRGYLRMNSKKISLRVSTLPTQFGEKVVIRLLDNNRAGTPMEALEFTPENLKTVKAMLSRPQGMILVTGPTGSGKTTTLYTAINYLKSPTTNVVTVEDPIEYQIPGVNQVQTNPKAGLTFAAGLRSILRQDPNVILVGEIRDRETAEIAFSAAQTGHLLMSTVHTNDTAATITRLLDIGIDPFLIASSVLGIVGQRLVRRVCPACAVPQPPNAAAIEKVGGMKNLPANPKWQAGKGCDECGGSGYKGRIAIHEVLEFNDSVRQMILSGAAELAIRNASRRCGMRTMMEDAIAKCAQGLTTYEEIVRVVALDEASGDVEVHAPIATPQTAVTLADVPSTSAPLAKQVVLVVEDSPTIASVVKYFLELEGYQMLLAPDGRAGLETARRERPGVIVSDLHMPDMDGITLVRELRGDPRTRESAILMLTSESSIDKETEALSAGADDYLVKPVEPRRLVARIKSVLTRVAERKGSDLLQVEQP